MDDTAASGLRAGMVAHSALFSALVRVLVTKGALSSEEVHQVSAAAQAMIREHQASLRDPSPEMEMAPKLVEQMQGSAGRPVQ